MYPAILLLVAPLISSSPSSVSSTANVSLFLGFGQHTDTPLLTLAKSRTSLLAKFSTPHMAHSPLSKMATKASRVRSIPGQIQRQAPATSSIKPVDQSPASPPPSPLPPPPPPVPIVPSKSQLRVDRTDEGITSASELLISEDGRPQETEDLVKAMIELAGEFGQRR
ncbi:hypothetical protein LWI28_003088 [Acer negundo]|uniref:Uncharacterized protein n=1 Tax=Acer negundo TaxID=4023 RepID=A0AAD5JL85_ACENE|nr:hypothetical protein LWI28_003088 [Acer negundo]